MAPPHFSQTTWNVEPLLLLSQTSFLSLDTFNMLTSDKFSSRVPQYSSNSYTLSLHLPSFPFSYFLSSSLPFPSLLPFMHLSFFFFPLPFSFLLLCHLPLLSLLPFLPLSFSLSIIAKFKLSINARHWKYQDN